MEQTVPPTALVLGCNTPHGVGVLSDWIEEHTGRAPDFADAGWSSGDADEIKNGTGYGYGLVGGDGTGCGDNASYHDSGNGWGDGMEYGTGNGDGHGGAMTRLDGNGYGDGYKAFTYTRSD